MLRQCCPSTSSMKLSSWPGLRGVCGVVSGHSHPGGECVVSCVHMPAPCRDTARTTRRNAWRPAPVRVVHEHPALVARVERDRVPRARKQRACEKTTFKGGGGVSDTRLVGVEHTCTHLHTLAHSAPGERIGVRRTVLGAHAPAGNCVAVGLQPSSSSRWLPSSSCPSSVAPQYSGCAPCGPASDTVACVRKRAGAVWRRASRTARRGGRCRATAPQHTPTSASRAANTRCMVLS
jgi:hypothetical protein